MVKEHDKVEQVSALTLHGGLLSRRDRLKQLLLLPPSRQEEKERGHPTARG